MYLFIYLFIYLFFICPLVETKSKIYKKSQKEIQILYNKNRYWMDQIRDQKEKKINKSKL